METRNSKTHALNNPSLAKVKMIHRQRSSQFIQCSDTLPKQCLLAKMVDHPEEEDDSDGDEEEFEHRVHSSSFTANLVRKDYCCFHIVIL